MVFDIVLPSAFALMLLHRMTFDSNVEKLCLPLLLLLSLLIAPSHVKDRTTF